jgi:hypothetical protein
MIYLFEENKVVKKNIDRRIETTFVDNFTVANVDEYKEYKYYFVDKIIR